MPNKPSFSAMSTLRDLHSAAQELEFHFKYGGEWTPLKNGDRVALLTPEGEFYGTVTDDWKPGAWPSKSVHVRLDCNPESPLHFHRTLFRAYTVLDHLADA